jgi:hypothetical protein
MKTICVVGVIVLTACAILAADATKHESDFLHGLKMGSASALIPGFGQAYVALALLGTRFDALGISVKDANAVQKWESFASGALIGHGISLALYVSAICSVAYRFGLPYGIVVTVLGPVSLLAVSRRMMHTSAGESNEKVTCQI